MYVIRKILKPNREVHVALCFVLIGICITGRYIVCLSPIHFNDYGRIFIHVVHDLRQAIKPI